MPSRKALRWILLGGIIACWCAGCSESPKEPAESNPVPTSGSATVYVVNYPLKFFAERIGGEQIEVVFPVPPGRDPAYWIPNGKTIREIQEADLILCNGASYAKWLGMMSLPASRTVDTTAAIREQYILLEGTPTHSHGPGGEHAHGDTASTTWLDPELASFQAEQIRQAFVKIRPQHEATFRDNHAALQRDLNELDQKIATLVNGKTDRPVIFSHPVYQYLARRYGLNAKSVHWEPDESPSSASWDELAALLKRHTAQWMIWEGDPDEDTVKRLEELGVLSVVFDPCGNAPQEGDYLEVMHRNVASLKQVYADRPAE